MIPCGNAITAMSRTLMFICIEEREHVSRDTYKTIGLIIQDSLLRKGLLIIKKQYVFMRVRILYFTVPGQVSFTKEL